MSNVISLSDRKQQKKAEPEIAPIPYSIQGHIEALVDWGRANGVDVDDLRFQFRLADFMALMQSAIAEKEAINA